MAGLRFSPYDEAPGTQLGDKNVWVCDLNVLTTVQLSEVLRPGAHHDGNERLGQESCS